MYGTFALIALLIAFLISKVLSWRLFVKKDVPERQQELWRSLKISRQVQALGLLALGLPLCLAALEGRYHFISLHRIAAAAVLVALCFGVMWSHCEQIWANRSAGVLSLLWFLAIFTFISLPFVLSGEEAVSFFLVALLMTLSFVPFCFYSKHRHSFFPPKADSKGR
jgi:hypothetical protein